MIWIAMKHRQFRAVILVVLSLAGLLGCDLTCRRRFYNNFGASLVFQREGFDKSLLPYGKEAHCYNLGQPVNVHIYNNGEHWQYQGLPLPSDPVHLLHLPFLSLVARLTGGDAKYQIEKDKGIYFVPSWRKLPARLTFKQPKGFPRYPMVTKLNDASSSGSASLIPEKVDPDFTYRRGSPGCFAFLTIQMKEGLWRDDDK